MKVLLHICCAPCLAGPLAKLRTDGHEVTGFFYNPNIHPLLEFHRRLKAVKVFQERDPIRVVCDETYGLDEYLQKVHAGAAASSGDARCARCYALRLSRSAQQAKALEMDVFTTTLLQSRHQQHERIRLAGQGAAAREGTRFLYEDFRPLSESSTAPARDPRLYRQSYCGCIFSEYERYRDTTRHLYRGGGRETPEVAD